LTDTQTVRPEKVTRGASSGGAPKKFGNDRTPDKGGEIREKRGDTLVSTLRKHYGKSFAPGVSGRMKLETLLKKEKASSLSEFLKKHKK
jgi:hypothetical protein